MNALNLLKIKMFIERNNRLFNLLTCKFYLQGILKLMTI